MNPDQHEPTVTTARRVARILLAALSVAVTVYLAAIPLGLVRPADRLATAEAILVGVVFLVVLAAAEAPGYVLRGLTVGSSGVSAQFDRIERRQDSLESDIRALQVALTGLINKYELLHLQKLSGQGPVVVRFGEIMLRELEHLDSMQFLVPRDRRGLNAIRDDHGSATDDFDLKQYVDLTTEGREYLSLRMQLLARSAAKAAGR